MIGLWASSIIMTLIFIASIPLIISGKGDIFIIREEFKQLYEIKRLRILMSVFSLFAAFFCILIPFMVKYNRGNLLQWMIVVFISLIILIIVLVKTWAKYK